jgi:hypothetical protein
MLSSPSRSSPSLSTTSLLGSTAIPVALFQGAPLSARALFSSPVVSSGSPVMCQALMQHEPPPVAP